MLLTQQQLTQQQLTADLRQLGITKGDIILVHSALSALGQVEGGADAVIDALLDAIGSGGTLLMPTLSAGVFDIDQSPSTVGAITEAFRQRKGVLRSFHPTHSIAAFGPRAEEVVAGHLQCPTACGEGTPYFKLMHMGGKILLLGVDQDRNTSLHTLEAILQLPFLRTIHRDYRDPETDEVKSLEIREFPGPHRDFIALDALFRKEGIMTTGRVGRSMSRLIDAAGMHRVGLATLRRDPAAILCDNPNCADCIAQRAAIKRHRLMQEDFKLCVSCDTAEENLAEALQALAREGVGAIELRKVNGREIAVHTQAELIAIREILQKYDIQPLSIATSQKDGDWKQLIHAAACLGAPFVTLPLAAFNAALHSYAVSYSIIPLFENEVESSEACLGALASMATPARSLAFNPARFAAAGEKPFLKVYTRTALKRHIGALIVADGTWDGTPTLPAHGNGEVKELVSILRCATFSGPLILRPARGHSVAETMTAFWRLLDSL